MIHRAAGGSWTRRYSYAEPSRVTPDETSNRLSATSLPGDDPRGPYSAAYGYDEHGNMTSMPHLPGGLTWDASDRLHSTARQAVRGGTPETTFYVYDAGGERLRKVTDREAVGTATARRKSERLYLGVFEIYREYDGDGPPVRERETLHVMDDRNRVALVETLTSPAGEQLVRYQHGNHLDSAALELDDEAEVISYEEYFPYGSTSYQAVRRQTEAPRRYRYTAKERDEENDLCYHGARYYAPWLGRWTSPDPSGLKDGPNLFAYVNNAPTRLNDPTGMQGQAANDRNPNNPNNYVSYNDFRTNAVTPMSEEGLRRIWNEAHPCDPAPAAVCSGAPSNSMSGGADAGYRPSPSAAEPPSANQGAPPHNAVQPAHPGASNAPHGGQHSGGGLLRGGYAFFGYAPHTPSNQRGLSMTGEVLLLGGYDRSHGSYVALLEGVGGERERHGRGPAAYGVTQGTEQVYYFRSGQVENENLLLGEAQLGSVRAVDIGIGSFISQTDSRESGVFVYGAFGPVTFGGGVTLHYDFEAEMRRIAAESGSPIAPGYAPRPVDLTEHSFGLAVAQGVYEMVTGNQGHRARRPATTESAPVAPTNTQPASDPFEQSFGLAVFRGIYRWATE
jgi:RHS repeat-associated protein